MFLSHNKGKKKNNAKTLQIEHFDRVLTQIPTGTLTLYQYSQYCLYFMLSVQLLCRVSFICLIQLVPHHICQFRVSLVNTAA